MRDFHITRKECIKYIIICIFVIAIDLFTKNYIHTSMTEGQSLSVIKDFFYITCVHNYGAAWGILSGARGVLFGISMIAAVALFKFFTDTKPEQLLSRIGLVLVFSGMLGNLYDRMIFGYVRDFLDFYVFGYNYPVFNVADMCIVVGVGLYLFELIIGEYRLWKFKKSQQEK